MGPKFQFWKKKLLFLIDCHFKVEIDAEKPQCVEALSGGTAKSLAAFNFYIFAFNV